MAPAQESQDLLDKVCVVTGATAGIGRATATALARRGGHLILPCRNRQRGAAIARELQQLTGREPVTVICDLASQAAIRQCADELPCERIDVLVHSAGGLFYRRQLTEDGLEAHFGVNYLGAFLLTHLLLPRLRAASAARVISVTGEMHRRARLDLDDLQTKRRYHFARAGARAILAKVIFTLELGRRLQGTSITANALHPGPVRSQLLRTLPWPHRALGALLRPFMRSPARGARTAVYLASATEVAGLSGAYFADEKAIEPDPQALDRELAARLWQASEVYAGLPEGSLGGSLA